MVRIAFWEYISIISNKYQFVNIWLVDGVHRHAHLWYFNQHISMAFEHGIGPCGKTATSVESSVRLHCRMALFSNHRSYGIIHQCWPLLSYLTVREGVGQKEPVCTKLRDAAFVFQRKTLNASIIKTLYAMMIIHSSCANEYASLMHTWKECVQRQRRQWRRTLTSAFNKYCSWVLCILMFLNVFSSACWIITDHQNCVGQHQTSIWVFYYQFSTGCHAAGISAFS